MAAADDAVPDRARQDRASVHAALGDPVRLAVVDELRRSDRTPKELADRFGLTSNLLAHHLDLLERVGLIERTASAGDRRRRYVRLVARRLTDVGIVPTPHSPPPERVVFVCSQNSARSQLAAALWSARTGHTATSAGTHPAERVHPAAVTAARRAGIDLTGATPSRIDLDRIDDLIITVCDRAHEEIRPEPTWWHWSLPDPVAVGSDAAFDDIVTQLDERIAAVTN